LLDRIANYLTSTENALEGSLTPPEGTYSFLGTSQRNCLTIGRKGTISVATGKTFSRYLCI
jgi:hypothetical protein